MSHLKRGCKCLIATDDYSINDYSLLTRIVVAVVWSDWSQCSAVSRSSSEPEPYLDDFAGCSRLATACTQRERTCSNSTAHGTHLLRSLLTCARRRIGFLTERSWNTHLQASARLLVHRAPTILSLSSNFHRVKL